ncbi:MAG: class I SAM-dependent methyltransferase [Bacteroidota bacterium]
MIGKLLSPKIQSFIRKHENEDPFQLSLKYKEVDGVPIRLISEQVSGRQKAKSKLPRWHQTEHILYPPQLSMEQCSSQSTAEYKAKLVKGREFIDLTGGTGVDSWALSQSFQKGNYVEQDQNLAELAKSNFSALGKKNIQAHHTTAEEYLTSISKKVDCIYIDPARRDKNKNRVFRLEDCTPNIIELLPQLKKKAHQVLIKTSPMMDIDLAIGSLGHVDEVHVIAVDNDCKEVLYTVAEISAEKTKLSIINFKKGKLQRLDSTISEISTARVSFSSPKTYLYEPNAAIMKAGAFNLISERFSIPKLHRHTHLYTSNKISPEFPGRIFKVKHLLPYSRKEIKRAVPNGKANITIRNFKDDVAAIRKKTGIKDGGELYLFGFTDINTAQRIAICSKVKPLS